MAMARYSCVCVCKLNRFRLVGRSCQKPQNWTAAGCPSPTGLPHPAPEAPLPRHASYFQTSLLLFVLFPLNPDFHPPPTWPLSLIKSCLCISDTGEALSNMPTQIMSSVQHTLLVILSSRRNEVAVYVSNGQLLEGCHLVIQPQPLNRVTEVY